MAPHRKPETSASARQPEPGESSSQQLQRQQQGQHEQRYESREANSNSDSRRMRTEENASRAMGYTAASRPSLWGRHEPIGQHMAPQFSGFLGNNADPGTLGLPARPYPPYDHGGHSQLSPPYEPSFAQVHESKRRRRRPEEIDRIYTCGWKDCTKGYGTLNHLNAHVTMQSHGEKRKPEEFKEIRRQWKARKKEKEQQERQRITDAEKAERPPGQ
ncbi:hypothetical protein PG997_015433 [Apiospora hydei]|uniref:C2H2-type domain-containing protein n=1 Tax=Apiospora hydei TaxID=1337664 RepID=A0ABR1UQN4_9PEZI